MGFDIYGNAGKFSRNNWGWYRIAKLCLRIAPEICASCKHWYSNDDDGLDDAGALALADALQAAVDSGSLGYEFWLDKQECLAEYKRLMASNLKFPNFEPPPADGYLKPSVLEFIEFLRHCGGFQIS
jgi:hypothetical protein